MTYKDLLKQKVLLEALLLANMTEADYIRTSKSVDWSILTTYYVSGVALAAERMQVINQLARR